MQAWLAFWMDGTTRRSKTFSSKLLGMEQARVLAIEFLTAKRKESGLSLADNKSEELSDSEKSVVPPIVTSRRLTARVAAREARSAVNSFSTEIASETTNGV